MDKNTIMSLALALALIPTIALAEETKNQYLMQVPIAGLKAAEKTVDPASSCKDILDQGLSNGDGQYTISLNGSDVAVWCDMNTHGGGWTLVMNQPEGSTASTSWGTVDALAPEMSGDISARFKMSDADINALGANAFKLTEATLPPAFVDASSCNYVHNTTAFGTPCADVFSAYDPITHSFSDSITRCSGTYGYGISSSGSDGACAYTPFYATSNGTKMLAGERKSNGAHLHHSGDMRMWAR